MRAIAEEAFAFVREYKGSHSGEHGDGIVRSEFHESMFGERLVRAFEEVKDRFDPEGPVQSRQDRARAEVRRPQPVPLRRRTIAPTTIDDAARLVGLSGRRRRFPGRGRDVQQQRRLPRARRRRDVPELSRHPRRARRHARPRQHAAARDHRPARAGRAHLRRDGGDDEALRVLQGLPARMPDRRRHGAHEDRGAGGARREASGCRCTTGWSAICRATRLMRRGCRGCSICATMLPGAARLSEASRASARGARCRHGARDVFQARHAALERRRDGRRGRAVRRHLQPLFRAREPRRRARGAQGRRLPRASCRSRRTARRGRCAAAARSSRSGWSTGARGGRAHAGGARRPLSRAAFRWSGWSRAACSASATRSRRC